MKKTIKSAKIKETEVAAIVVEWLEFNNWGVFKEVAINGSGGERRIDIVAVKDGIMWGLEVKSSFCFKVICQANNWKNNLHKVSVVVPSFHLQKKDHSDLRLAESICKDFLDFGLIQVNTSSKYQSRRDDEIYFSNVIKVSHDPLPKPPKSKLPKLYEEQKISEAGNNKSEFHTVFKGTVTKVNNFLADKEECNFTQMLETIGHHYSSMSSAKTQLAKFVGGKLIPGFKIEKRGRENWLIKL